MTFAASDFSARSVSFSEIPQVDIGPLRGSDRSAKLAVARAIDHACTHVGFLYVCNHGVPRQTIDGMFAASRRFFDLPEADKQKIDSTKSLQHRGYVSYGTEQHDPKAGRDLHEALDFGRELPEGVRFSSDERSLYGPNQWPADLPGFEQAVRAYYAAMLDLGHVLLRGFALSLELDETFFFDKFNHACGWLRLLHYRPQERIGPDGAIGVGAHTDYECFTILAQDENSGLQVRNLDGDWIAAPPIPGTFVINIADLMARWTNDRFRSTLHRSINRSGKDRYSIPFFFGTNADTLVECIPTCIPAGARPQYQPVKASDWVLHRVKESQPYLQT